jgi:hypothetical protein
MYVAARRISRRNVIDASEQGDYKALTMFCFKSQGHGVLLPTQLFLIRAKERGMFSTKVGPGEAWAM